MPTVVILKPDGSQQEHSFDSELVLGRGEDADVKLTAGGVSRRHARVYVEGPGIWVEDLGSSNGTFVDSEAIAGPTLLREDSSLVVGEYQLTLKPAGRPRPGAARAPGSALARVDRPKELSKSAEAPLARGRRTTPEAQSFDLVGITGPWAGKRYPIEGKLLVGRTEPADVLVDDGSVSRRHAEVELTPGGAMVRDLGSANGTRVNEQAFVGDAPLFPGDVVQFGVIEFSFKERVQAEQRLGPLLATPAGAVPVRKGRARSTKGPTRGGKLAGILAAVGIVVVLLVVLLWKLVASNHEDPLPTDTIGGLHKPPQNPLEAALAECRTYAASEGDVPPNWDRAQKACERALDIDALNRGALELMRRIRMEKAALEDFNGGDKSLLLLKEEEALAKFARIPPESIYYFKAKPRVLEAANALRRRAGEDCRRYMFVGLAKTALPRCQVYMDYACQNMTPEELRPPVNFRINLGNGKLRNREWRPRDPIYLTFLRAREKVRPAPPPWECKRMGIAETEKHQESPESIVKKTFETKFSEKAFGLALFSYWSGRTSDAVASLQRFVRDTRKAAFHKDAEELRRQMTISYNLFQRGEGELQRGNPERAADSFDEALKIDETLMGMPTAKDYPSFYRRNIQQDMGRAAYLAGKDRMDRQDTQPGCRVWKLGFRFTKQDTDLLRAIEHCSELARTAVSGASSCSQLHDAVELAVEGDGVRQKAAERESELHCTGG